MKPTDAFHETRSPFLLEVLEALGTEEQESFREDERAPGTEGECKCVGCLETEAGEAFEAEDAYETEQEDETGPPDAFERYQAAGGEEAWESSVTDEAEDMGEAWTTPPAADETAAESPQDFAEAFEADAVLETEDEAPDLAYDVPEQESEAPFVDELDASEMDAPGMEAQVPPPAQVVVSNGEFGSALARYALNARVPNAVPWLLRQSAAFNAIVKVLDAKYLHLDRPSGVPQFWGQEWAADDLGVFAKGPHVGRRMVTVRPAPEGSYFRPIGTPDAFVSADLLGIETPLGPAGLDERGAWLERILHETIHAHRHVLGLRRSGSTPAARIQSGIDDEIATRTEEGAIVNDLRNRFPNFHRYQPTTGSTIKGEVERDFFSGALRMSYLEHFVLGERLEQAREALRATFRPNKRANTVGAEISAYDAFVDRIPLEKRPLASYLVDDPTFTRPDRDTAARFDVAYPRIRLIRRIIDARWRSVPDLARRNVHRDPELERMRQEHVKAFFARLAAYTQLP